MGTQQELTTEQVEVLVWTGIIEVFDKEQPGNIPAGGIKEILDCNNIMNHTTYEECAKALDYYGYLQNGDELTTDGKQYIALLAEEIETPAPVNQNIVIVNNKSSLLNIEKIENDLDLSLIKLEASIDLPDMSVGIKKLLQVLKEKVHK